MKGLCRRAAGQALRRQFGKPHRERVEEEWRELARNTGRGQAVPAGDRLSPAPSCFSQRYSVRLLIPRISAALALSPPTSRRTRATYSAVSSSIVGRRADWARSVAGAGAGEGSSKRASGGICSPTA